MFSTEARGRSAQAWASRHRALLAAAATAVGGVAAEGLAAVRRVRA
ncbi:hypothetical protein [Streptomyces iconiensis]|uniref:Uncharacterized protein n=1 Tax=Streptomyces iconiensis TaxID=1384038 RepID=A0ABT6ZZP7_9ACTN|nr:hypothetical protein [Streptomyces iconiensis]MDJ1134552.1 hypothetical protein [Streptomyces iconiensis]